MSKITNLIMCDLEATCWIDEPQPAFQASEIIEIGAVKIDIPTLKIIDTFQTFVRPVQSSISKSCTALTSITWEDVKQAPPLQGAVNNFIEFGTRNSLFATWGYYDCSMFQKMVDVQLLKEVPFKWAQVLNAKVMMQLCIGEGKGLGQATAAAIVGIPPNENAHRADSDAMESGLILAAGIRAMRMGLEF